MKSMQFSVAPEQLWQAINPWTFNWQGGNWQGARIGFVNVDLGATPRPDIEQAVLDEVGSYGRQIGRIGDALEVLLRHVRLEGLTEKEQDALDILQGQIAEVRKVKAREA
ncbi:MAG: hypothetical protein QM690_09460 [Sphingobium sp.]